MDMAAVNRGLRVSDDLVGEEREAVTDRPGAEQAEGKYPGKK